MVAMSAFSDLDTVTAVQVWEGVVGRIVGGDRVTVAVIELDPGSVVPEHSHEHEQIGVCVAGSVDFRVGDERREVGPGDTWWIPGGAPHEVRTGPDGAVVVETWAPKRDDWAGLERLDGVSSRWPR
jgi:quercetin dioxygenase-like cupin family protein